MFWCCSVVLGAQSVSPEVLSNAGSTSRVGNIQIAWTLGEIAVDRWATPQGASVSEGFHQPQLRVSSVKAGLEWLSVAPNPVQSILRLNIDQKDERALSATLLDVQGKVLQKFNHLGIGQTDINLHDYPTGLYFLSIQYLHELPLQTFKIVKVQ